MARDNDLSTLDGLVKRVYGKTVHQYVPDNVRPIYELFPFVSGAEQLGDKFVESVNLGIEQGVKFMTANAGVQALPTPIAGVNKQTLVDAAVITMRAFIAWDLVAKAKRPDSNQAFENSVTTAVDNIMLSHRRFGVMDMLYGGDSLAIVATNAAAATTIEITAASCAPGIWIGGEGMLVDIYSPNYATKRNASPLVLLSSSVDNTSATRTLTFSAAVTVTAGDVIVPPDWVSGAANTRAPGLSRIAGSSTGVLFGLDRTTYPQFKATEFDCGNADLTFAKLNKAAVLPFNRGYTGKVKLLVNPVTFAKIAEEEHARIHLLGERGNASGTARVGYSEVILETSSGYVLNILKTPWIKEGEAYFVPADGSVKRIGTIDFKLGGPMDNEPAWRRLENDSGYQLPTFSMSAVFTPKPWFITRIKNITNT